MEHHCGPKPKPLELHRLPDLYATTYNDFVRGDYKHVIHRRAATLQKALKAWKVAIMTCCDFQRDMG
eukprot:2367756-Amphidinium_carterae.1